MANAEARTLAHNLAHPEDLRPFPHEWVPSAVFTDPQIASVGARLQDLAGKRPYVQATQAYQDTAYGWALRDTSGICRLYADPATGKLLGAHILGYQASLLIQPLVQAMSFGQDVASMARGQYWIHPALSEVVETPSSSSRSIRPGHRPFRTRAPLRAGGHPVAFRAPDGTMTAPQPDRPQVLDRPAETPAAIGAVLAANAGPEALARYDAELDAAFVVPVARIQWLG